MTRNIQDVLERGDKLQQSGQRGATPRSRTSAWPSVRPAHTPYLAFRSSASGPEAPEYHPTLHH